MKLLTRQQFLSSGIIDTQQPLWLIGPSYEVLNYKEEILSLKDKNTMAIGHCWPEIVLKWDFVPSFFTWYDPHQTHRVINNIDQISKKCSTKTLTVIPDFSTSRYTFPANSGWRAENQKSWDLYENMLSSNLFDIILAKTFYVKWAELGWKPPLRKKDRPLDKKYEKNERLASMLRNDPDFRFNHFDSVTLGTVVRHENLLTLYLLPILHYMGFKTIFVLGFDGDKQRFYQTENRIAPTLKNFEGIEKWIQWEPFHQMKIINIQKSSPLSKKIETISFEESLRYSK